MKLDATWLQTTREAWAQLGRLKEKQERYERVVVSAEPLDHLKRYCRVLQPTERGIVERLHRVQNRVVAGSGRPDTATTGGWCWVPHRTKPSCSPSAPSIGSRRRETLDVLCGVVEALNADRFYPTTKPCNPCEPRCSR